jgi:uncharacterized protein (UPF0212 family)
MTLPYEEAVKRWAVKEYGLTDPDEIVSVELGVTSPSCPTCGDSVSGEVLITYANKRTVYRDFSAYDLGALIRGVLAAAEETP